MSGAGWKWAQYALVAEADDVVLDLARVVLQLHVAQRIVVALGRVEERRQRDFRVDDDVLSARQLDDDVGRQPAVFAVRVSLISK